MAMSVQFQGLTAARKRLAELQRGLHRVASGEVVQETIEEARTYIDKVAFEKLAAHRMSGEAAAEVRVDVEGSIVEVKGMPPANGKRWKGRSYLSLKSWWPFRRGMPGFVVKHVSQMFARRVLAALGGREGDLGALAGGLVDEAEAAAGKAAAKRAAVLQKREEKAKKLEEKIAAAREKTVERKAAQRKRNAAALARALKRGVRRG